MNLYALVMAGGSGTRFWPESTETRPKQFLSLFGEHSLIVNTLKRFDTLVEKDKRFVVTIEKQKELAINETSGILKNKDAIILEPSARNTGPCILLALASLEKQGMKDDDVVVIVPSDHIILNEEGFRKTVKEAAAISHKYNKIVTIGITPNFPHTGFGYIEKGALVDNDSFTAIKFKEKPAFELAREYVASGKFLWNAGMFVAKLSVIKKEFEKCSPEMYVHFKDLQTSLTNEAFLKTVYAKIPSDSIDYAVMEKSKEVLVIPAQFDWNDLGSWDALGSVLEETDSNTIAKDKGHYFYHASDNIIFAPDHFVSLMHVKDMIVVVNKTAVMILPKSEAQDVKKIVEYLKVNRTDLL